MPHYATCRQRREQGRHRGGGGVEVVVAAMRAHASVAGVQEGGCYALHELVRGAHSRAIVAASGTQALVVAMRAHVTTEVHRQGCFALFHLTRGTAEAKATIRLEGGAEALHAAMCAHRGDAEVQHFSRLALDALGKLAPAPRSAT